MIADTTSLLDLSLTAAALAILCFPVGWSNLSTTSSSYTTYSRFLFIFIYLFQYLYQYWIFLCSVSFFA